MTTAKWAQEVRAKINEALSRVDAMMENTYDASDPFDAADAESLFDLAEGACETWRDMWRVAGALQALADDVCPIMARHMMEGTDGMPFESADFVPPSTERERERRYTAVREHYIDRRDDLEDDINDYRRPPA